MNNREEFLIFVKKLPNIIDMFSVKKLGQQLEDFSTYNFTED